MQLDYTVATNKSYEEAIEAVKAAAAENSFRVQFVHDVQSTLAEKGFEREPLSIVEVCNAKYAAEVLARDVKVGLMLPCPIMVYTEGSEVFISTMRPSLIGSFFPDAQIEEAAAAVERTVIGIVDSAAG